MGRKARAEKFFGAKHGKGGREKMKLPAASYQVKALANLGATREAARKMSRLEASAVR